MRLKSRYWADLSTLDFSQLQAHAELSQVVAVLPVAATEQHGPHLPLSVDTDIVDGVIASTLPRLAPDLPVLVLPTQVIGKSNEHERFPGTLTLSAQTLIAVWMELGASIARTGIRKLLLFNAHGGQLSVMDIVARDLRARHNLIVYSSNWYGLPQSPEVQNLFSAEEQRYGIHAGAVETSMLLALRPQWVDMGQARDFKSASQARGKSFPILGDGKSAKLGWQMQDYNALGAAGNATLASAEKGTLLIESAASQLVLLLQELSALPLTTLADGPNFCA